MGEWTEMISDPERDQLVLTLRDQGRPFAGIAADLELDGAAAAAASFNRALRMRPKAEQERLRNREMARLDAQAVHLRARVDLSVEEIVRRMRAVKRQRKSLFIS